MWDSPARLKMVNIAKRFGTTQALNGVNLEVAAGEVHALVGENGAGKSTLMKILAGAYRPDRGEMWLDGEPFTPHHPLDARRRGIAMIYQELSLAPHLSVMENILLGVEPARWGIIRWRRLREQAYAALSELGLADLPLATPVHNLPPGHQQMVEIARAVISQAKIVVLDEPTSSLTQQDVERLFTLIRRLRDRGLAVIYISHFLEEVHRISDRFTVLRDGETVGSGITSETPIPKIVALMVGREVSELYPRRRRTRGPCILEVEGLTGIKKPVGASLRLHRGEILGIAGLVGAGRTEFLRAIFGLDPVRAGDIRVGVFRGAATPGQRWQQGVGFLSEDRKREGLALSLSIAENITLSRVDRLGPLGLVFPGREERIVARWIDRLSIRCENLRQPTWTLSGGNQQKVALARLFFADVDVLLLDEPTRGIDVGSKAQIYRLIAEAADGSAGTSPKAVLMVSSYLPELLGLCDTIAVMSRGRLVACRPAEQWTEHTLMLAATGQDQENSISTP